MWLWRLKEREKYRFWAKLIVISLFAHTFLLFCVLFLYRGYGSYTIYLRSGISSAADVIVLPLYKRAPTQLPMPSAKKMEEKKEAVVNKMKTPERAQPKEPLKTKLAPLAKPKKKRRAKKIKKAVPKKIAPKPVIKKKLEQPKQLKKEEPVIPVNKHQQLQAPASTAENAAPNTALDNPVYVGREEIDILRVQEEIQQEVATHWKAPIGLESDVRCDIQVTVQWDGAVAEVQMLTSSHILIFDMSAQEALQHMQFPKAAWGKKITIVFT